MSWFIKKRQQKIAVEEKTIRVPEGLWIKCEACRELIYKAELTNTHNVCPKCGYHFRISVEERLASLMDPEFEELFANLQSKDCLNFKAVKSYADQLRQLKTNGHQHDAVMVVDGTIDNYPVIVAVMDWSFLAASMGCVVGEKLKLGAELALKRNIPYI